MATIDRKKVLNGLERWATKGLCAREECQYFIDGDWEKCCIKLAADALALLKDDEEQAKYFSEQIDEKGRMLKDTAQKVDEITKTVADVSKKYHALMEAYDCARVKLENAQTGNFYTIKRGHARYGFCSSEGRIFFVVYAADKKMPMGELPEGHEENRKTVAGFYLHDAEEVRMLGEYFLKFAAALEEHPEWGGNDDGITDCERSTRDDGADRDGGV